MKRLLPFILFLIVGVSFFLRLYGIFNNHPFWVDEFSSANQARYILKYGLSVFTNPNIYFESHNITTHFLVATFFKLFGQYEWSARLPFVIIGSFIPLAVFFLSRYIFNTKTAIVAALLTTFSYFEIVWSRQARGYILFQLLVLIAMLLYLRLTEKQNKSISAYTVFSFVIILGILTHSLFYILLITLILHFILFNYPLFKIWFKKPWIYFVLFFLIAISYGTGFLNNLRADYSLGFLLTNNFWYYHSFLWREYGLITFLGFVGLTIGLLTRRRFVSLIVLYIFINLIFLSFFFQPYVSRYLLPIFPHILIGMAYSITHISELFMSNLKSKKNMLLNSIMPVLLTLFVIINGYKFVTKPKSFYSVNHDFREIAIIDYDQIYNLIKEKGELEKGKTMIVDTWWDRLYWYLGQDYSPVYAFRWMNEKGYVNGLPKSTPFIINSKGEKIIPKTNNVRLISNLADFKKAMSKYPKGFIFIDDSSLPHEVIEYAEKKLKKEIYLDHYSLDDNPYSIWPATLYSWGIK